MIVLLVRIILFIGLVAGVYLIVQKIFQPSGFERCSRCEGKGFWYDARGKEICAWCEGSGKLPRNPN